jgi:hypothetical protein
VERHPGLESDQEGEQQSASTAVWETGCHARFLSTLPGNADKKISIRDTDRVRT